MPSPFRIVAEHKDDYHVISHLLSENGIENKRIDENGKYKISGEYIEITHKDGVDNLLYDVGVELKEPNLKALGFILDADSQEDNGGIQSRWESILNSASKTGDIRGDPQQPDDDGTTFLIDQPDRYLRVGVWLMPDNESEGAIERFLIELIPENDPLLDKARKCISRIPTDERPFEGDETKALIRTWLAWQSDPGQPPGQAISADSFDVKAELALQFVNWVQRLFPHLDVNA